MLRLVRIPNRKVGAKGVNGLTKRVNVKRGPKLSCEVGLYLETREGKRGNNTGKWTERK